MDDVAAQFARVDEACAAVGRDPKEIVRSVAQVVCVGRTDEQVKARALAIGREVDDLRANGLAGSPEEVADRLGQWVERTGITRVYLQVLDLGDLDHLELLAAHLL
jgi:alkanesulfonate monooxygenase